MASTFTFDILTKKLNPLQDMIGSTFAPLAWKIGHKIYVIGERASVYDLENNVWTNIPRGFIGHTKTGSICNVGTKIYLTSGSFRDVIEFDTETEEWYTIVKVHPNDISTLLVSVDNRLHMVQSGGDIIRFDPKDKPTKGRVLGSITIIT